MAGKEYLAAVPISAIRQAFSQKKSGPGQLWLLMDRDKQADDNAEHLYRYLQKNHPEQKIVFALRKSSHDWTRLKAEGFNLVNYNSWACDFAFLKASKIISSQGAPYIRSYFLGLNKSRDFIYLQHGVVMHNIASVLNRVNCDLFLTSTLPEYQSIVRDYSPYLYSKHNVALTGMPRHDALLSWSGKQEKIILVMPTWRKYLAGEVKGKGDNRKPKKGFMDSNYAKTWQSLLCSEELKFLCRRDGYQLIFFPHHNMQHYLRQFELPAYIKLHSHKTARIQELFGKMEIMITDYSSVAFELAYLKKAVIYYQFDSTEFYNGSHTMKGYFDYAQHGFGPVCHTEADLLEHLAKLAVRAGEPEAEYLNRMEQVFIWRDGKNCERTYRAICGLDGVKREN